MFCHPSSLCYFSHRRDPHLPQNLCTAWNILSSYLWDSRSSPSGLCSDVILSMSPYSMAFEIPPPLHHHTVCSPEHWANSNMWYYITYIFTMFTLFVLFPPSTGSTRTKCFCFLHWCGYIFAKWMIMWKNVFVKLLCVGWGEVWGWLRVCVYIAKLLI